VTLDLTLTEGGPPDCAALAEPAIIFSPRASVGEALARVKEAGPGVAYVAVAGDEGFRGLVSVASLVSADPSAVVGNLAVMPAAAVPGETSAERAAWLAAHAGEDTVAVLDADGRLQGLIPGHRLLGLMMREHEVDLARLGGFLRGTPAARALPAKRGLGAGSGIASPGFSSASPALSWRRGSSAPSRAPSKTPSPWRSSSLESSTWPTRWARRRRPW